AIPLRPRSNIIDVSAADSQGMEQHEYMDRARQYSTRLAMLSSSLTRWRKAPPLPSLTNQPHQVLASEPVPSADLQQV
ncbi:LTOR1 protein, partial [Crypturellus soui]|nr:LTOR1 protein [Crypturellus soui]